MSPLLGAYRGAIRRDKELIVIDLHTPEGQDLVRRLAGQVDIVVENFRPHRLTEWGLGFDQLVALYPSLIMVSISGYGQTGPYRDRPGFGNIAESMGGLRAVTGYPDSPPLRVGVSLGDQLASLYAVIGALLALRVQDRTGESEHVDVALTEAVVSVTEAGIPEYVHEGVVPVRNGNRLGRAAPTGVYQTLNGNWVAIGANGDSIFRRLATALGHTEWLDDQELSTNRGRVQRVEELDTSINDWTSQHTIDEVVEQLNKAGVPCGTVYTVKEISEDPHFRVRQAVIEAPSADRDGPITMPGIMPAMMHHPGHVDRTGGPIGRDTTSILHEMLGLTSEEINDMKEKHIIADHVREPERSISLAEFGANVDGE